ncbi:hypothetical protein BH10BAC6_BH10BAC6_12060 [soil metagenome]
MRSLRRSLLLLAALLLTVASSVARDPQYFVKNSEGKEFWLCFMKNFRENNTNAPANRPDQLKLQLFITSGQDANVRIQIEEIDYDLSIKVQGNTVVNVQLPARAQLKSIEQVERLAVHVTADTNISVYGLNSRFQTTDTYLGLPTTVLGMEYRAMGYNKLAADLVSQIAIIATEDSTQVTLVPTATTAHGWPAGQPMKFMLQKGDVYTVAARFESIGQCDLTGSLITSDKKIAVFSGHNCAYVPAKVEACNHLVEQLPPVSSWGKHFYLGQLKERSKYTYRVVASENGTRVFENSKMVAQLRAGEFYENINVLQHLQVTADKPVLVAQFAQGFKNGDSVGDPMMIFVSPTQQFLNEYRFATPINGDWHHYINVVAPTNSIATIRLNGRRIDSTLFEVLGESRYSIAAVPIPYGTHVIKGDENFGLYSYGFGFRNDAYDAYGNMAGQSFFELNKYVDTLAPIADGKVSRDNYLLTIRDDRVSDKGLKSVRIDYATGIETAVPPFQEGAPLITLRISASSSGGGRMVFSATDVANNRAEFTLCKMWDTRTESYVYILSDGPDAICTEESSWFAGAFLSLTHAYHTPAVGSMSGLSTPGIFNASAQGAGGWGGLVLGRQMTKEWVLTGKLMLNTFGGELLAPDSIQSAIYNDSLKTYVPYQEGTVMRLTAPYLSLALGAEFYPMRSFYLLGGVQASLALNKSVHVERRILRPGTVTYSDGTTSMQVDPESLDAVNTLNVGLYGGLGYTYPISFSTSVFLEGTYTTILNNIVSDGAWRLEYISLSLGARYRW